MGGRGLARDLRTSCRDARGCWLPGIFGCSLGILLRAQWKGAVLGKPGAARIYHHRWGSLPTRWRLYRSSDLSHLEHRASVLGLGQEVGTAQALPIGQLEHFVL